MILIGCCAVNHPVGCILMSKESPRPAVYTTWKIWKKIVKHNFGISFPSLIWLGYHLFASLISIWLSIFLKKITLIYKFKRNVWINVIYSAFNICNVASSIFFKMESYLKDTRTHSIFWFVSRFPTLLSKQFLKMLSISA